MASCRYRRLACWRHGCVRGRQARAHHLRGDAEEVRAILPLNPGLIDHPEVSFMDQGGGLESVAAALAVQVATGEPPQFPIDHREQQIDGLAIAMFHLDQELRDVRLGVGLSCHLTARRSQLCYGGGVMVAARVMAFCPFRPHA